MNPSQHAGLLPGGHRPRPKKQHAQHSVACPLTACRYNMRGTCIDWLLYGIAQDDVIGTPTSRICYTAKDESA